MPRYRIDIEYDGTRYAGWQRQAGQPTIQEAIERAIFALSGEEITLKGAGRTDAGVHALHQVGHFDLTATFPDRNVRDALNAHLTLAEETIAILSAERVDDSFDSRFSAKGRHYLYRIGNRRSPFALDRERVWHVKKPLDVDAMQAAADRLIGHHDFTTFRSAHCQSKSPMKTLDKLVVRRSGEEVEIRASARSFLHNQVRSLVGTLRKAGDGSWTADDVQRVLEARDRTQCGPVAPAHGLYLVGVDY